MQRDTLRNFQGQPVEHKEYGFETNEDYIDLECSEEMASIKYVFRDFSLTCVRDWERSFAVDQQSTPLDEKRAESPRGDQKCQILSQRVTSMATSQTVLIPSPVLSREKIEVDPRTLSPKRRVEPKTPIYDQFIKARTFRLECGMDIVQTALLHACDQKKVMSTADMSDFHTLCRYVDGLQYVFGVPGDHKLIEALVTTFNKHVDEAYKDKLTRSYYKLQAHLQLTAKFFMTDEAVKVMWWKAYDFIGTLARQDFVSLESSAKKYRLAQEIHCTATQLFNFPPKLQSALDYCIEHL